MNTLNKPEFLQNNKTFQTIYGRNLLHELNIIIPEETLIVTMEDLWGNFSNFFTKNVQVHLVKNLDINTLESDYEKIKNFNAVIGIGGVANVADVVEFILAGATMVQIGTMNYQNPNLGPEIKKELLQYCTENKIEDANNLIGKVENHSN